MSSPFIKSLSLRRSIYQLTSEGFPLSAERLTELVRDVIFNTPGSFNTQPVRAKILLDDKHKKLWDEIVPAALKPLVPESDWPATAGKLAMFANAHGTILFFEDEAVTEKLADQFPTYAAHFPGFAGNSTGAAQINTWTALSEEKIGGNLQHYHPLINESVAKEFDVPASYKLTGQLVFGSYAEKPEAPVKTTDLVTLA